MAKKLVNSLPYDFSRCAPETPDSYCRACARYQDVEGQTWGPWTPVMYGFEGSTSESCRYIPATWEDVDSNETETKATER